MLGLLGLLLFAWFGGSIYAFLAAINLRDKVKRQDATIQQIQEELKRFRDGDDKKETTEKFRPHEPVIVPQFEPPTYIPTPSVEQKRIPVVPVVLHETILEPEIRKPQPPPPPRKPSRTQEEWEALIGGKILNRIGALALIIGVGFFLKYAFDNNWITETMRVVIGVVTGFALLFGGDHFQKKNYKIFSQGLSGSGIAILYLSVYSAFNFYHLVPQIVAMLMMSAVTVITFWQAFKYDSQVIALFGWLGGFLTPFLLSTGQANEIGLFSYIALLDLGLLLVASKKEKWFLLEPLSLLSTILVFSLWFGEFYSDDDLFITIGFSIVFWLLFAGVEFIRINSTSIAIKLHHQFISLANGAFLYLSLFSAINPHHHQWMGLVTTVLSVIYFLIFLWIRKKRSGDEIIHVRYLLPALLLSVIASGTQFDELEITIAWAIESFLVILLAMRYKHAIALFSGVGILVFASISFVVAKDGFEIPFTRYHFLANIRALALLTMACSAFLSYKITTNFQHKFSSKIRDVLCYAWILFLTALMTIETGNYSGQLMYISEPTFATWIQRMSVYILSMEWNLFSLLLWYFSRRYGNEAMFKGALVLLSLALFSAIPASLDQFRPIEFYHSIFNYRSGALAFLALGLFLQSRWTDIYTLKFSFHRLSDLLRLGIVVTLFIFLTVEVRDYFFLKIAKNASGYDTVSTMYRNTWKNQQQLSISIAWLAYSMLLMVIGIYRKRLNIRIVSILLFGLTIAKVFFYDLSYLDSLNRIISFIGLGVILILVSFLYQKYKHIIGLTGKKSE